MIMQALVVSISEFMMKARLGGDMTIQTPSVSVTANPTTTLPATPTTTLPATLTLTPTLKPRRTPASCSRASTRATWSSPLPRPNREAS